MKQSTQFPQDGITNESPPPKTTLGGGIAFVIIALALLWAVSNPVVAASVTGAVAVVAGVALAGGRALARRLHGRITELTIPGIATVRISVNPN